MSQAAQTLIRKNQTRPQRDRRRHQRVALPLRGKFMHDEKDHPLRVMNISCGGALFRTHTQPEVNTEIVCYLDELGRLPARITRRLDKGFAVAFDTSAHKRDKLADQLTWLANRKKYNLEIEDIRGAPRKPASGPALIKRANGQRVQCRVVDISLTGAALQAKGSVPVLGEHIQVGKLKGEVVRSIGTDFAIRFLHDKKSR